MSAVGDRLRERAAAVPGEPALVTSADGQETIWTWRELESATARVAARLGAAGGRPGRSALVTTIDNGPRNVLELIAVLRADTPVAVLAKAAPEAEVAALEDSLLRAGHDVIRVRDGDTEVTRTAVPAPAPLPADSLLLATGGSSGRPKIAIDTWARIVTRRPRRARPSCVMNWRSGQRQLVVGPLSHAATLTFFAEGAADGSTLIVPKTFDPAAVLETIQRWHVEWLQLTPYHMRHLAIAARRDRTGLPSVNGLLHLAAPCPRRLKREWIGLLGADRIFEMYGATEGVGLTIARGDEWLSHPGTVGRGFFTRIRILDEDGTALPHGEVGEVYLCSGSPGRRRYVDAAGAMRMTADGFASVGDRGWMDEDGYLYLAPRQLVRIQVGGETVDPEEVESVLMEHPGVLDAGVAGKPDERLGEALVALVVPAGSQDPRELTHYLRKRVARHKVPRLVSFTERMPRTAAGKLDRRRLAELAELATGQGWAGRAPAGDSGRHKNQERGG